MDTSLSDLSPVTFENKGALTSIEEELEEQRAELHHPAPELEDLDPGDMEPDGAVASTSLA